MNQSLRAVRKIEAEKSKARAADREEGLEPARKAAAKDTATAATPAAEYVLYSMAG